MKYYIIAGEASGDIHGAHVVSEILKLDPEAVIRCWGGDKMQDAGAQVVKHYKDLAFMGFAEVVKHLGTILKNIKFCKADILVFKPDAILMIDYPGFNLRIAQWAKENHFPVCYYVSPQIWAWKESRISKIKKGVDKMYCILPFEPSFYQKHQFEALYAGNPSVEEMQAVLDTPIQEKDQSWITKAGDKKIVALLPGSRKQEIVTKLPLMLEVVDKFPDCHFIIAQAPALSKELFEQIIGDRNVTILPGKMYEILKVASAAIVTSGTATLETALLGVPQMVCYKTSNLSYQIGKRLIKVKYISLVNLILDKPVLKEFIQQDLTVANMYQELQAILTDKDYQDKIQSYYTQLWETLGTESASKNVAKGLVELAKWVN